MTTQTKPGVRISEDIRRQQGQAIVSVAALPTKPETLEFALHRYDCFANHLGPRGWQGTECWLTPEEAWYRGDELQFVLRADWAEHLENTTYQLALRGRGLDEPVAIVFRWPSELTVETDNAEPRRVLGGAQIRAETETGRKPEAEAGTVGGAAHGRGIQRCGASTRTGRSGPAGLFGRADRPRRCRAGRRQRGRAFPASDRVGAVAAVGAGDNRRAGLVAGANPYVGAGTVIGHRTALAFRGARSRGRRAPGIPGHPRADAFGRHRRCQRGE